MIAEIIKEWANPNVEAVEQNRKNITGTINVLRNIAV
jgi:hypothetical protein